MSTRGYAALPKPQDEMTMADVEAQSERLGLVIVTDGKSFDYARPGHVPPGFRVFRMVQKPSAPADPNAPRLQGEATDANKHARDL